MPMDYSIRKRKRKDERLKLLFKDSLACSSKDKNGELPQKMGLVEMEKAEEPQEVINSSKKICLYSLLYCLT